MLREVEVGEHHVILAAVGGELDGGLHISDSLVDVLVQIVVICPFVVILGLFGMLVDVDAQFGKLWRQVGVLVFVVATVTEKQQEYLVSVIMEWIKRQYNR